MPTLTWTTHHDDAFEANSTRRVPEGVTSAHYRIDDDTYRPYGPKNTATPWLLSLVWVNEEADKSGEIYLGHHATLKGAKETAETYEETGKFSPAACLPDKSVVATTNVVFIKDHPTTTEGWSSSRGGYHGDWKVDEVLRSGGHVLRVGPDQEGWVTRR